MLIWGALACSVAQAASASQPLATLIASPVANVGAYEQDQIGEFVPPVIVRDPGAGAWLQFAGRHENHLLRISEAGTMSAIALPALLRGRNTSDLEFAPLGHGQGLATAYYWPRGATEQAECSGIGEPAGAICGEVIVAVRTSSGRWTPVDVLRWAHGKQAGSTFAVGAHDTITLGWWQSTDGPYRIATARLGHPFGRSHKVAGLPETPRVGTEVVSLLSIRGRLYVRGKYVAEGKRTTHFEVLRPVFASGRLGSALVFGEDVINEPVEPGDGLEGAGGSELLPLEPSVHDETVLEIRRRSAGSAVVGPPRVAMRHLGLGGGAQFEAESESDRTLLLREQEFAHRAVLSSVQISPQGIPGRVRVVERLPSRNQPEAPSHSWAGAVNDGGSALVATTTSAPGEPIWLHPSGSRCPSYGARTAAGGGGRILELIAGARGRFHITWEGTEGDLQIATAVIGCR